MKMGIVAIKRTFWTLAVLSGLKPLEIVAYETSYSLMMLSMLKHVGSTSETVMTILV